MQSPWPPPTAEMHEYALLVDLDAGPSIVVNDKHLKVNGMIAGGFDEANAAERVWHNL